MHALTSMHAWGGREGGREREHSRSMWDLIKV